jgi:hypothetical protein
MTTQQQQQQQTNVWQYKCFVEWCKTVLFAELLPAEGARVALLGGSSGADTGKLQRAHIAHATVVDSAQPLRTAMERWHGKGEPFECVGVEAAPHVAAQWRERLPHASFDAVFTFDALDFVCTDERLLDSWLGAAAAALKPNGCLAGLCADSAQLWSRAQKAVMSEQQGAASAPGSTTTVAGVISSDLFDLSFALGLETFLRFGTRYVLTLHEGTHVPQAATSSEEYRSLVHFASLIRLARTHRLRFVEATNLLEFYEDHKRAHAVALKQSGMLGPQGKGKIEQADLIGMYSTFVFVKLEDDERTE